MTRPDATTLIEQTKLAFDLQQRLYAECALLIRELELLLQREPEHFVIAKPGGYGVATRRSVGLSPMNVQLWPLRKFGILFVPQMATLENGQKPADFGERCLYLRFLLDDYGSIRFSNETLLEPSVIYGVFTNVSGKKRLKKLEHVLAYIEYRDEGVFARLPVVDFEDGSLRITGTFQKASLFSFTDGASVAERLAKPALALYRGVADIQSS
jgi:hypothetical protein